MSLLMVLGIYFVGVLTGLSVYFMIDVLHGLPFEQ